jgi:hypothetical protein
LASSPHASAAPASLVAVLAVTFLGSVSGGAFWAGIFFVTAGHYGFSPLHNLLLASCLGAVYALAARGAGRIVRALERRMSARALLAGTLVVAALLALVPLAAPRWEPALWLAALIGVAASAVTWPIVESYLAAARHGARMRSAIGWFNITWTPAVAVALLTNPFVARWNALGTLVLAAAVNLLALVALAALPRRPAPHGAEAAAAAVGREYPQLLRATSWMLPLSYLMSSTLAPVLPHRLAAVGSAVPSSVIAATWMAARFVTLLLMWRTGFWHGRWGTLLAGGAALAAGLAAVLLAPSLTGVVVGLGLFGIGMGLTYYTAIYYSLAVGHAAVEASGSFEALIGLGYCVGPLLGVLGHAVAGARGAPTATVGLVGVAAAIAAGAAARPYLVARRSRAT